MKVVVTGAFGQIGTALVQALRDRHGRDEVLATGRGIHEGPAADGPTAVVDVTDPAALHALITREAPEEIYHLASVLSAVGEHDPERAWNVNLAGLKNVLEVSRGCDVERVFWPSSIAVFGPSTPRDAVPQETVMRPTTMYGVTKVAGELLGDYYASRFGLDVRGVRYPGIISAEAPPGGGTTDYAVEIFRGAVTEGRYEAFVGPQCTLPMMYMTDCIEAALRLMAADLTNLRYRTGYNVGAMSFALGELVDEIRRHVPEFVCTYAPDERQAIADSWPRSLDDGAARDDWGWAPTYDLPRTVREMLERCRAQAENGDRS